MKQEKNNNNHYDYDLANGFDELAGGVKKNYKNILDKGSQINLENQITSIVGIMEELKSRLQNIKRTDVPMFLDPKTATFIDVAVHAKVRQYLSESTIEKHLRYARFMEFHPMPIDFKNLTPESFLRHVDYRLSMEETPASPNALKHEKRALLMFLRAFKEYNEDWKNTSI